MPTTGRRNFVALAASAAGAGLVVPLLAAEATPFASIAKLATALSENDPDSALDYFDPGMKHFGEIEQKLEALTAQADISCALDIVTDVEADGVHKLDIDWLMQLKSHGDDEQLERRRERVQIEMRLIKRVWKITVISPLSMLNPLRIR